MLDLNEIEILQVALAHEERARAFYERMAARHGDTPAAGLFSFLASEEEGHIRKLTAVHGIPEYEARWEEKYLPHLLDLDRLAEEEGEGGAAGTGEEAVRKGLSIAKKAETHAISFYNRAGSVVEDKKTAELLAGLEAEERLHLAKIEAYLNDL